MKVKIAELINVEDGFTDENDIFNLREFGDQLKNLVMNEEENMVIALEGKWGIGKSTFIKQWKFELEKDEENAPKIIYYDAFENDYQRDPFLSLVSEIYDVIPEKSEFKKEFLERATNITKSLAKGALKIGTSIATAGALSGHMSDDLINQIGELTSDQVDVLISNKIKTTKDEKATIDSFKASLEIFTEESSQLVFIIDELDRCRPDFALDLLEKIKHLFAVKNTKFILVINNESLKAIIESRYGLNINSTKYFQKFIDLTLSLPQSSNQILNCCNYIDLVISHLSKQIDRTKFSDTMSFLKILTYSEELSLRDTQRIISLVILIHRIKPDAQFIRQYQVKIAFVCFLKTMQPDQFEKLTYGKIEINRLVKNLAELLDDSEQNFLTANHYQHNLLYSSLIDLRYDQSTEEERNSIAKNSREELVRDYGQLPQANEIGEIAKWLSNLKI